MIFNRFIPPFRGEGGGYSSHNWAIFRLGGNWRFWGKFNLSAPHPPRKIPLVVRLKSSTKVLKIHWTWMNVIVDFRRLKWFYLRSTIIVLKLILCVYIFTIFVVLFAIYIPLRIQYNANILFYIPSVEVGWRRQLSCESINI